MMWYLVSMPSGQVVGGVEQVNRPRCRHFPGPAYKINGAVFYRWEDGDYEVMNQQEMEEDGCWPIRPIPQEELDWTRDYFVSRLNGSWEGAS